MSVLDQAFFKAYGLVEEPTEPGGSPVACAGRPVASAVTEPADPFPAPPAQPPPSACILVGTEWYGDERPELAGHARTSLSAETAQPVPSDAGAAEAAKSAVASGPTDSQAATEPPSPAAEPSRDTARPERTASGFSPQLQVDRYFWPAEVIRLCQIAEGPLDAIIDTVALDAAHGKNGVGVGHCRSGDGATTLLLCLARRLAQHGVKVALVDADLCTPRLARRLGILAELGWEDVRAGRVPLAETAIESLHDRLVLIPRGGAKAGQAAAEGDGAGASNPRSGAAQPTLPAAVVAELRRHYDLVLVDLGNCGNLAAMLAPSGEPPSIDQVLVVRNARRPWPAELAAAVRQIRSSGIGVAVVDNFV